MALWSEYPANITCEQDVECVARIRELDAEQFSWHYIPTQIQTEIVLQ